MSNEGAAHVGGAKEGSDDQGGLRNLRGCLQTSNLHGTRGDGATSPRLMPAEPPLTMPTGLLSPFPELDTDLPQDFVSLFSTVSLQNADEEQQNTHSSCPINLNDNSKSKEPLTEPPWPLHTQWGREPELPSATSLRLIPFQADRSVSMIEDSKKSLAPARPSPSRYKTELCRPFHESGNCKYGSKCQFAHGTGELRGLSRHPKYKTELCRTYHTIGFCPYGSRCHFIHNAEEQRFSSAPRGQKPPLLRHSVSCSGIPSSSSSSSSSSLSLFSTSLASSLTSLSPFSPSSPVASTSNPFSGVAPLSPTSPPITLNLPLFGTGSPPRADVQDTVASDLQLELSPWRKADPKGAERWDTLPHPESEEESASAAGNSQEAKRLPIFSFLSD